VITIFGLQTGRVFGAAVVVETVFALPGLARLAVDSAAFRDYSALQGAILVFALAVLLVNLLTDLLCGAVDPRIRHR
jgi:glutathione transport system permease protein